MAGDTPATATETPAADTGADLLDDAAPAEAGKPDDKAAPAETKADDKPANTESKPDAKASGDDKKGEGDEPAPDLLADDDEGKSPDKADGQADAKKDKAPETYEAFTLPEGVQLDEAAVAKVTPIFKDLGLTQEQAQKLVSQYADLQAEAAKQQLAGFNQTKKDWAAAIKADPEYGGDKLTQTLGAAKAVLNKFGDATLRSDLKEWGWANHPGLIRLLASVNAHLSEDTLVNGDAAAQSPPTSEARRLYPNMPGDNQ